MTPPPAWHLAQVNIGRIVAPLDSAEMTGFVSRLDELNALADGSPGFVWRFQNESGNATYLRPYDDDRILFNLSVWESPEHLRQYVYGAVHAEMIRQRHHWFEKMAGAFLALWWIPAGHRPTVDEAKERLTHLHQHGPGDRAFTFRQNFPPPAG